jgi:hypothetical protein
MPAIIAARIKEVPSGAETLWPSMVSETVFFAVDAGVPKSISCINDMLGSSSAQLWGERAEIIHMRHCERSAAIQDWCGWLWITSLRLQ